MCFSPPRAPRSGKNRPYWSVFLCPNFDLMQSVRLAWSRQERHEIIDGTLMTPGPVAMSAFYWPQSGLILKLSFVGYMPKALLA